MKSTKWPHHPSIYEIHTWVWLAELSAKYGTFVELGSVPAVEWDAIAEYGFDAVWLMGVWERSLAGTDIANHRPGLIEEFSQVLPDFHPSDNVGSAYCVRRYEADQLLGGSGGLALARAELAQRGIRLILDFVPNHVAPDHPWVREHPEYFIPGSAGDAHNDPASFLQVGEHVFACGRDPYFPAWPDVLQLNGFHPGLRQAVRETLSHIASQCDGVRCDMAMLLETPIFERTWGSRAGERPGREYWAEIIEALKRAHPDFLFMAEAYWDREWELLQQGFDFCYDKRLYDRLAHDTPESVQLHLGADDEYQRKLVRFIENHDEPRSAAVFPPEKLPAAAVAAATLPGARLFYEGQLEGRKVRPPVFLGRRPAEKPDRKLQSFYRTLLKAIDSHLFHEGQWRLCGLKGWPDNQSFQNLLAWSWETDDRRCLIVINMSGDKAQARVQVPWNGARGESWQLNDALTGTTYDCGGDELESLGVYVELDPWDSQILHCYRGRESLIASAA